MGSSAKELRKQLRNICLELLPELIKNELFTVLQQANRDRLELIAADVKKALADISDRQKDVQNMIMRDLYSQVRTQSSQPSVAQEETQAPADNA